MDTAVLKIFIAVMRQGSFAAVARERNIDPASVSRAIASLEKELGVRLFHRTTRKLSPTEAGIIYFDRIEPLMAEMHFSDRVNQRRPTKGNAASNGFGFFWTRMYCSSAC